MVNRRTGAAMVGAGVALALVLTACSGGPGGGNVDATPSDVDTERAIELDFAWWGDASRGERYDAAVAAFNLEYPNITVRQSFQSWDDYWTARNTEAAASSLPDVVALDAGHALMYGQQGQLLDLGSQIGANLDVSSIQESLLAAAAHEGAQYAVPIGTNSLSLLYNTEMLEALGVEQPVDGYTWDDYAQLVAEISEAGAAQDPAVYGTTDFTGNFQMFSLWLVQQGVTPYVDGEIAFTAEDASAWLHLGDDLRADGLFTPQERLAQLQVPAFNVGVEATSLNWSSALGGAINDLGSSEVGLVLPPSGPDGPSMYFTISQALGASAHTDEPDAASVFIDFLINSPEVGEIFGTSRGVPASASQREGILIEEGSVDARVLEYTDVVESVATGTTPIEPQTFTSIEAEWKRLSEELQYGNITVEEYVDTFFTYVGTL